MSFWSWLTGHSDKESDVYANYDKVAIVTDELGQLAGTGVNNAAAGIYDAINRLNNVKGFSQYVGSISPNAYEPMFNSISESISGIGKGIYTKAEQIKAYNDSSIFEKLGSTVCMGLFKAGEGLLSVGEDLIDAAASVVGWVGGLTGAKDFQNDIANYIAKDHAHDLFNFYYNSDFAKKSLFTEDSALAGACKLVGKTVGYLYAGGVMAGIGSAAGLGSTAMGTLATGLASGTTWGATAAGFLGGMGAGVAAGLKSGQEFNQAMGTGLRTGAVQGALAFAGGKLGEHLAKSAAIKNAPDQATADSIRAMKASSFEGYSDSITKAGQEFGKAQVKTAKAAVDAAVKGAKSATAGVRKLNPVETETARQAAAAAKETLKVEATNLAKANPITQGAGVVKTTASSLKSGLSSAVDSVRTNGVRTTLTSGVNHLKEGLANTVQNISKDGLIGTVKNAATSISPAVPGVAAQVLGSGFNNAVTSAGNQVTDAMQPSQLASGLTDGSLGGLTVDAYTPPTTTEADLPTNSYQLQDSNGNPIDPTSSPYEDPTDSPYSTYTPSYTPYSSPSGGGYSSPSGGGYSGGRGEGYSPYSYSPYSYTPYSYTPYSYTPYSYTPYSYTPYSYTPYSYTPYDTTRSSYSYEPLSRSSYDPYQSKNSYSPYNSDGGIGSGSGMDGNGSLGQMGAMLGTENLKELEDGDALDEIKKGATSLDALINGSKLAKLPTSTKPSAFGKSTNSSVIPISAGLSAAAAVGLGVKAYMDTHRKDDEEEDVGGDDEFFAETWNNDPSSLDVDSATIARMAGEGVVEEKPKDEYYNSNEVYNSNMVSDSDDDPDSDGVVYPYYFGLTHDFDLQE